MNCLLVYDIPDDRTRTKIADFCLDYGLDRIQYSAFVGNLSRTHQEELMMKIKKRLGKKAGKVQLFPLCAKDWEARLELIQEERSGNSDHKRVQSDGRATGS
ncbi:MAG: CRISPR-associated endonuclease Cas2 [Caldilineales bacterium]|nr:CRISPR-associated endonuclease Cas2 [Caldilineales bacterium]